MNNKSGGEIVRELRINKSLTIKQLGELVDTHYVFLSRLERNMEKPSEELIIKLSKVLGYEGNIDVLIASFGRLPQNIEKMLLEDPQAMIDLPVFFKKRKKR